MTCPCCNQDMTEQVERKLSPILKAALPKTIVGVCAKGTYAVYKVGQL